MRYMTESRRSMLAVELLDRCFAMKRKGVKFLKEYEFEYKKIIKAVCPEKDWWNITSCPIGEHLLEYKDPEATAIQILKELKED